MDSCTSCLSQALKDILKENTHPSLHKEIDEFPNCGMGVVLQLCPVDISAPKKRRSKGEKRPRSAYQEYISQCMKSKPIKGKPFGAASGYMKECAEAWRKTK